MQPEEQAFESSTLAHELWQALASAYGEIGDALGESPPPAAEIKKLTRSILELEARLQPLLGPISAWRAQSAAEERLQALWLESDRIIDDLCQHHPALVRAAVVARDGVGEELLGRARRQRTLAAYLPKPTRLRLAARSV